jgi:hypothetical protein
MVMSTVGTITKLATEVVGKAASAVTHPRRTVSAVTGHARDLAATVTGGGEKRSETKGEQTGPTEAKPATKKRTRTEPQVVPAPPQNTEPAEPVEPASSVEPSTTEPKAASRQAAHQGRGSEPTDDWHDELDPPEDEINPATGQPHSVPDDEPLLDPSVAKAVRAESETLSKAADPDKG